MKKHRIADVSARINRARRRKPLPAQRIGNMDIIPFCGERRAFCAQGSALCKAPARIRMQRADPIARPRFDADHAPPPGNAQMQHHIRRAARNLRIERVRRVNRDGQNAGLKHNARARKAAHLRGKNRYNACARIEGRTGKRAKSRDKQARLRHRAHSQSARRRASATSGLAPLLLPMRRALRARCDQRAEAQANAPPASSTSI